MSHRSHARGHKLKTDRNTDYMLDYFMASEKFHEAKKEGFDAELEKKQEKRANEQKLAIQEQEREAKKSHKSSSKYKFQESDRESPRSGSDNSQELEDVEEGEEVDGEEYSELEGDEREEREERDEDGEEVEEGEEADEEEAEDEEAPNEDDEAQAAVRSPYEQRIDPKQKPALVVKAPKLTPEEQRARRRTAFAQLEDLVKRYKIKLTQKYTINSDPIDMEEEFKMQRERRHKNNKIKWYKGILLNGVFGIEFLNETYDPFSFKLKDWSKHVAMNVDEDYTDILEELYDKYKGRGGSAPQNYVLYLLLC